MMRLKSVAYISLFLFGASTLAFSAIYEKQDADGNIIYTDTPSDNASRVNLPKINVISPKPGSGPAASSDTGTNDEPLMKKASYKVFTISSPKNEETIQNQPIISVNLNIEPKLQDGDKIQIFMDGNPVTSPEAQTSFNLHLVNRGTHQLYATLMDKNNKTIMKTNEITIFVHKTSVINSPAAAPPNAN